MGSVIERKGYTIVDGFIVYDEHPSSFAEAEKLAGHRLDRRRNYCLINGQVTTAYSWPQECSGCEGHGCRERGYNGTVRVHMWLPIDDMTDDEEP